MIWPGCCVCSCVSVLAYLFSRVCSCICSRVYTLARVLINNLASLQSFYYILYGPWDDTTLLRPKKRPGPFSNIVVHVRQPTLEKCGLKLGTCPTLENVTLFRRRRYLTTDNLGSRAVTGASRIQPTEEQDILGFT